MKQATRLAHATSVVLGALVGCVATLVLVYSTRSTDDEETPELRATPSGWISPLLECRDDHFISPSKLARLRSTIRREIGRLTSDTFAKRITYYFKDLNQGGWISLNEDEQYAGGSLFKVALMIAYFKQALSDPQLLSARLTYRGGTKDLPTYITPSRQLVDGETYTVDEAIEHMIRHSDNRAKDLLGSNEIHKSIFDVLKELDIPLYATRDRASPNTLPTTKIRSYARLFRILYNGTYIGPHHSEKALKLLATAEYTNGLKAGVPADIEVAHKFGERDHAGEIHFHDCGVVYYPGRPYLVCVMTAGLRARDQEEAISKLSRLTFQWMRRQH